MRTLTGSAVKGFFESFSHQKAEGFHFMNLVETRRHNQLSQVTTMSVAIVSRIKSGSRMKLPKSHQRIGGKTQDDEY